MQGNLAYICFVADCFISIMSISIPFPGGGALECNLTVRCLFFENLHNLFGKNIAFRYPVSKLLNYKISENNRETIVYCSSKQ